jgi:hypothetical protein
MRVKYAVKKKSLPVSLADEDTVKEILVNTIQSRDNLQCIRPGLAGSLVDSDLGLLIQERLQFRHDVLLKEAARQVAAGVLHRVKAVENLDVFISDEQLLRPGARDPIKERLSVLAVNGRRRRPVLGSNLKGNF